MLRAFLIAAAWMPLASLAAEQAPAASAAAGLSPSSGMAGQIGQLLIGLLLVIGLILALAWAVRRMQAHTPGGGRAIRIVASQALGVRERLILVQVGNEQVLIGVSAGRITPLHVLTEPVPVSADGDAATPEFARRLMEMLGRDQKDKS